MPTTYNKLVRDRLPELLGAQSVPCAYHTATPDEYHAKLLEKLVEEAKEVQANPAAEELADLLEVVDAIIKLKGITQETLAQVKQSKAEAKGLFEKRLILEWS